MRRRDLLKLTGGMAVASQISTHAQQRSAVRHVGVFLGLSKGADDPGTGEILRPHGAMGEMGWTEDKNLRLEHTLRWW